MDAEKLTRWMRKEHEAVGALTDDLRRRIAALPLANRDKWWADLGDSFEHFRAHLLKHMSLEEKDGYLTVVSEKRPSLHKEIDRLKREHHQLTGILKRIHEDMQTASLEDELLLRDCCSRISTLLDYVNHHEQCENLLVLSVFTDDIGTKD